VKFPGLTRLSATAEKNLQTKHLFSDTSINSFSPQHHMNLRLLLLLFLLTNSTFGQRTLTNPIILVHGWTGSNITWDLFSNYLEKQASLSIEGNYLNYNLNCDYNLNTSNLSSDVCDNTNSIGNRDVYIVNFNSGSNMSNQSAVVKQGYALKFAISRVLRATGADKVMLLGHSMGGLAIREYLQNPSNWQSDGQHHVAKLATIGTPHRGSNVSGGFLTNIFTAKDEDSEAVRDLRESYLYSGCTRGGQAIQCPGVYLWGGQETRSWMKTNALGGSSFYNIDVNCNGNSGDNITGLNQKSISTDLDFACIIGGPSFNDGIVSVESQNLNTLYPNLADLFYWDCSKSTGLICHTQEPKQAFMEMLQALDEPKKYPTIVKFSTSNKGFFTSQTNGSNTDRDDYSLYVSQRGVLTFSAGSVLASNAVINISDPSGKLVVSELIGSNITKSIQISTAGYYNISIQGSSLGTWATYNFSFGLCGIPVIPTISASSSTTFCEGLPITLSTITGYDEYRWFKDGVQVVNNSSQLSVNQTGVFTVQASKCGITSNSTNNISTIVKPVPAKPAIQKDEQPDQFLLTSSSLENNQWLLNGNLINGATSPTFVPQDLGNYTVKVSKDGCFNNSDVSNVRMDKPTITLSGSNPLCEGDSLKLVAPSGFGNYIFSDGAKEISRDKNELVVKKASKYYVATKRGKFISVLSDPISIIVNPKPTKPTITIESFGFKSSSPINNQWYLNQTILKDSTGQFLRNVGAGAYSVRVTLNGCFSESDALLITATEPNFDSFLIKLYPNPNEGTFWVELPQTIKKWTIEIFDIQGRQIFNKLHSDYSMNREAVNINKVSGTYILRVTTDKTTQSTKFIVD
jgi:pimeloyl-ACP methyl ester carboxylesterase